MTSSPLLSLDQVTVDHPQGSEPILSSVSLHLHAGECHILMGDNGCGKSTLLHSLIGHPDYTVSAGQILWKNTDITSWPAHKRALAGIFLAFQRPVSLPGVTWLNFLKESVNARRKERKQDPLEGGEWIHYVQEALDLCHIPLKTVKRFVNDGFSGGEQKRMEMLQIAMLRPECVLLDELDSGLDIDGLRLVADLRSWCLKENPQSLWLVVTHSPDFAKQVQPHFVHVLSAKGQWNQSYAQASCLDTLAEHGFRGHG